MANLDSSDDDEAPQTKKRPAAAKTEEVGANRLGMPRDKYKSQFLKAQLSGDTLPDEVKLQIQQIEAKSGTGLGKRAQMTDIVNCMVVKDQVRGGYKLDLDNPFLQDCLP